MNRTLLLVACLSASMAAWAFSAKVEVKNVSSEDAPYQPVVVRLADYPKLKMADRAHVAVLVDGKQISSQLDDMDADGTLDELAFVLNVPARSSKTVTLKTISDKKRETFPKEMYADMWRKNPDKTLTSVTEASSDKNDMYNKMHHHGVAWESDLMAYRIYFDNKSTIDLYGKKTPQLELAESLWYPTDEQLARGFGDDILRVSGSVGLGAVKPWNGKKAVHIDKFAKRTQRIVTQGNVRTVCETEVEGWQYEGKNIHMTVRYIMYAHHRDCEVQVTADCDIDTLATGVQKVKGGTLLTQPDMVGCWGTDWPVNDTVKYAKETVGLGLAAYQRDIVRPAQDKANNLLLLHYRKGETLQFYITAVSMKEIGSPITNADQFFAYLRRWRDGVLAE